MPFIDSCIKKSGLGVEAPAFRPAARDLLQMALATGALILLATKAEASPRIVGDNAGLKAGSSTKKQDIRSAGRIKAGP